MKSQYKGIVFDLDGVLTETSKSHFKAWSALARKLGFELPSSAEDDVRGISRMASLEIVLAYGGLTNQFTPEEKVALATEKNELYLASIATYTSEQLSEGAKELLVYLKAKDMLIALASASQSGPFLLEAMGIIQYFDCIIDPRTVEKGKPAPDIFARACEALGLLPENCIGVEDAYAGIESIVAAGLYPVGIGSKALLTNCEDVFPDLTALKAFLCDKLL